MAKAYSLDLRKKVINALKEGHTITKVSKTFKIARRTIYDWQERLKEGKPLEYKQKTTTKLRKVQDLELFKSFASKNNLLTAKEMAIKWEKETKIKISDSSIKRTLKLINFTHKKVSPKYKEACEEAREKFKKEMKNVDAELIFYIDESHVKNDEYIKNGWAEKGKPVEIKKKAVATKR